MIRIGIIGHRFFARPEAATFVGEQCRAILQQAQTRYVDVAALSAIAEGADSLFAEAALLLNIPLEIVRPFAEYAADFTTEDAKERYARLRQAASHETKLAYTSRSDEAYLAAARWVIEHVDLIIVAWDGQPARGVGGTGDGVRHIMRTGRDWIHLNIVDRSTTFHSSKL